MSKIGFLVECGPQGLETRMLPRICQLIAAGHSIEIEPEIVPMSNKELLLEQCGSAAAGLLQDGCERVVILWDERPAWPSEHEDLCWSTEREKILAEIATAKVPLDRVGLVCIEREFESWLLADHTMLSSALSRPTHPFKAKKQNNPERLPNPKGTMISVFKEAGRGRYNEVQHAGLFVEHLSSLTRFRKCKTFKRFEQKVRGG